MWVAKKVEVGVTFGVTPPLLNILERVCIIIERIQLAESNHTEELKKINRRLDKVMANQAEFDAQIAAAHEKLDAIAADIATVNQTIQDESQEVQDFIAANPTVDTSALAGVVERLGVGAEVAAGLSASVEGIFTAPSGEPNPEEPPVEEPEEPVEP